MYIYVTTTSLLCMCVVLCWFIDLCDYKDPFLSFQDVLLKLCKLANLRHTVLLTFKVDNFKMSTLQAEINSNSKNQSWLNVVIPVLCTFPSEALFIWQGKDSIWILISVCLKYLRLSWSPWANPALVRGSSCREKLECICPTGLGSGHTLHLFVIARSTDTVTIDMGRGQFLPKALDKVHLKALDVTLKSRNSALVQEPKCFSTWIKPDLKEVSLIVQMVFLGRGPESLSLDLQVSPWTSLTSHLEILLFPSLNSAHRLPSVRAA